MSRKFEGGHCRVAVSPTRQLLYIYCRVVRGLDTFRRERNEKLDYFSSDLPSSGAMLCGKSVVSHNGSISVGLAYG